MQQETLEDHLRRTTRHGTARLPEDQVFALGADLARQLAAAHGESPRRHPDLEPSAIVMESGGPRLTARSTASGDVTEDVFRLGVLLNVLSGTGPAEPSWRLDGPPASAASPVRRRWVLAAPAPPRRQERFATAEAAAHALEAAQGAAPATTPWPMFRGDARRLGVAPAGAAVSRLEPLWHSPLGAVVGAPVPTGDVVLAASRDGRLLF